MSIPLRKIQRVGSIALGLQLARRQLGSLQDCPPDQCQIPKMADARRRL
jgi:hypothetical protein